MSKTFLMSLIKDHNENIMNEIENENRSRKNSTRKKKVSINRNNFEITKGLKFIHWNANSLNNKIKEFNKFILQENEPDIVSIDETKLSEFRANMLLSFTN